MNRQLNLLAIKLCSASITFLVPLATVL